MFLNPEEKATAAAVVKKVMKHVIEDIKEGNLGSFTMSWDEREPYSVSLDKKSTPPKKSPKRKAGTGHAGRSSP